MKYILLLFAFLFLSCTKETDCCVNYDANITFSVKDLNSVDLLNPENQIAFKEELIKIYYVIDNVPVYQNSGEKKFSIIKRDDLDKYVLYLGVDIKKNLTTTLIKWNDSDTDTINCEISRTSNSAIVSKVWYNNELKYDGNGEKYFEVIK